MTYGTFSAGLKIGPLSLDASNRLNRLRPHVSGFVGVLDEILTIRSLSAQQGRPVSPGSNGDELLKQVAIEAAKTKLDFVERINGYSYTAVTGQQEARELLAFAGEPIQPKSYLDQHIKNALRKIAESGLQEFEAKNLGLKEIANIHKAFIASGEQVQKGSPLDIRILTATTVRVVEQLTFHNSQAWVDSVIPTQDIREVFAAIGHPITKNSSLGRLLKVTVRHDQRPRSAVKGPAGPGG
ncbi:MAG: hypothetical protein AB7H77_10295 [Bdellovibrionales bacterium]